MKKTNKVLIISNSHGAFLKKSYLNRKDWFDEVEIDWFIANGNRLSSAFVKDSKLNYKFDSLEEAKTFGLSSLTMSTSNLLTYDHIIIYGLHLPLRGTGKKFIDKVAYLLTHFTSSRLTNKMIKEVVDNSVNYKISSLVLSVIKEHSELDNHLITSLPCPFPNESMLSQSEYFELDCDLTIFNCKRAKKIIGQINTQIEELYKDQGLQFLSLPEQLLSKSGPCFTSLEFKSPNKLEDVTHLNVSGSELVLEFIASVLKK